MSRLPSFSSTETAGTISTFEQPRPSITIGGDYENILIADIYCNAARVLYYQRLRHQRKILSTVEPRTHQIGDLPNYETQIRHFNSLLLANLRSLPTGSAYESALLFPIGIVAREVYDVSDRAYVLSR